MYEFKHCGFCTINNTKPVEIKAYCFQCRFFQEQGYYKNVFSISYCSICMVVKQTEEGCTGFTPTEQAEKELKLCNSCKYHDRYYRPLCCLKDVPLEKRKKVVKKDYMYDTFANYTCDFYEAENNKTDLPVFSNNSVQKNKRKIEIEKVLKAQQLTFFD